MWSTRWCLACGVAYQPNSGVQKYCGAIDCRNVRNRTYPRKRVESGKHREYSKKAWHRKHPRAQKICPSCQGEFTVRITNAQRYCSARCAAQTYQTLRQEPRKNQRQKVQYLWGYANSRHRGNEGGQLAEEAAPRFLKNLGFENIVVASIEGVNFPWDIIAERGGQKYVIQVTMSVRAVHKYSRAAQALGVHWAVLFIKPDLTRAILKVPPDHIKSTYLKAKEVMPL